MKTSGRNAKAAVSGETPRVGRPPRVNVQAIINAALDIGLKRVTLKRVADKLGVGVATLYRHVKSRDELVRLAAFQITLARRLPATAGAHWSELAVSHAETLFESFLAEPQLITELIHGRIGPHVEIDVLEQFLDGMRRHGFSEAQGVELFHAIGTLVIGAAVGALGTAASRASGHPWDQALRRALAERDPDELPRVRRTLPRALEHSANHWRPVLRSLLAGVAQARGETLSERPHQTGAKSATTNRAIE